MGKKKIDKKTLDNAKKNTKSTIEASKLLAKQLLKQDKKKQKVKRKAEQKAKTEKTKRDVKKYAIVPIKKQTNYERRLYMRNHFANEKQTVVRHVSSHSIETAKVQCLAYMQSVIKTIHEETKKELSQIAQQRLFPTRELRDAIESFGPSQTDCIRNAMRKLAKQDVVKIHKLSDNERTRVRYKFELVKLDNVK